MQKIEIEIVASIRYQELNWWDKQLRVSSNLENILIRCTFKEQFLIFFLNKVHKAEMTVDNIKSVSV